ncbi:MAG: hypothetical protein AAB526_00435 [Patescibacteria group bacterium]
MKTILLVAVFAISGMFIPLVAQTALAAPADKCILDSPNGGLWNCNVVPEEGKIVQWVNGQNKNNFLIQECGNLGETISVIPYSPTTGEFTMRLSCIDPSNGLPYPAFFVSTPYVVKGKN